MHPYQFQANIIQTLLIVIVGVILLAKRHKNPHILKVLFLVSLFSMFLCNLFWITNLWIETEPTYYFSATDIAIIGSFLLIYSILKLTVVAKPRFHFLYIFGSLIFYIWNVYIWYSWSGTLISNILIGIPYGLLFYILCVCLLNLRCIRKPFILIGIFALLFVAMICETLTLFVGDSYMFTVNLLIDVLFGILVILSLVMSYLSKAFRFQWCVAALLFCQFGQYGSVGIAYSIFVVAIGIVLVFLYRGLDGFCQSNPITVQKEES